MPDVIDKPLVSVIMPVRNEEEFIERSVSALLRQTYPAGRMEIIIADGCSTDATREIVSRLAAGTEIPIHIVENPKRIAPAGLNRALEKSCGEIIIRVDGHCEVDEDYVSNCVKYLQADKAEGVGGPIETIGETPVAQAIAVAMSSKFGVGGSAFRTVNDREIYVDTVAFPGYKRETIEKAGAFDEELVRNQDDEYNYRIRKMGGRILLAPDISSRYYSRGTFRSLWRQYYQYGYWKVRVMQLHPRQMSVRQLIPAIFVSALMITFTISIFSYVSLALFAFVVLGYLLANISAGILAARARLKLIPLLCLSFAILHLSYGSGFLIGLAVFRKRLATERKENTSFSQD